MKADLVENFPVTVYTTSSCEVKTFQTTIHSNFYWNRRERKRRATCVANCFNEQHFVAASSGRSVQAKYPRLIGFADDEESVNIRTTFRKHTRRINA